MIMSNITRRLKNGIRFGTWELGKPIAAGGQGEVWEARSNNTKHSPPRAIKVCFADEPVARGRFEQEVHLLQQLKHQGIPPVVDSDLSWTVEPKTSLSCSYYVSERFDHTLTDLRWIHASPLYGLQVFRELCDVLEYLHSRTPPIIHRDLKPANVLLGSEPWRLVLADFGIARIDDESHHSLTRTHEVVGTTFYRAPEALMGVPATARSDVYSLGRTLEWLLTGRDPVNVEPRPVPHDSGFSERARTTIDAAIRRACALDPQQRFESVRQFRESLPDLRIVTVEELEEFTQPAVAGDAAVQQPAAQGTPSTDYRRAVDLLRTGDTIGWRELIKPDRKRLHDELLAWYQKYQHQEATEFLQLNARMDDLLLRARQPLAHAVAATEFSPDALRETTRLFQDILHVPGWNGSGYTVVVNAPRSLLYVAHNLLGASAVSASRIDIAAAIARSPVTDTTQGATELWQHHDLVGWPKALGGHATEAWKYLFLVADRHDWISSIFGSGYDYQLALVSYWWILNFIDFAASYKNGLLNTTVNIDNIRIDVPPVFLNAPVEVIQGARLQLNLALCIPPFMVGPLLRRPSVSRRPPKKRPSVRRGSLLTASSCTDTMAWSFTRRPAKKRTFVRRGRQRRERQRAAPRSTRQPEAPEQHGRLMSKHEQNPYSPPHDNEAPVRVIKPLDHTPLALKVSVVVLALIAASTLSKSLTIVARADPNWLNNNGASIVVNAIYLVFCAATWKRKKWGVVGLTASALIGLAIYMTRDVNLPALVAFRAITLAPAFYYWKRLTWR